MNVRSGLITVKRRTWSLLIGLVVLVLGVAVILVLRQSTDSRSGHSTESVWHATWAFRPQSLAEAMAASTLAVEAEVTAVNAGPDLTTPSAGHGGTVRIPTQRITFSVVSTLAGTPVSRFQLFKTGAAGDDAFYLGGDPPYHVGERYVLFMVGRGDGSWIPVGPDARVVAHPDGRLQTFISGPLGTSLASMTLSEVQKSVVSLPIGTAVVPEIASPDDLPKFTP